MRYSTFECQDGTDTLKKKKIKKSQTKNKQSFKGWSSQIHGLHVWYVRFILTLWNSHLLSSSHEMKTDPCDLFF